MHCYEHTPGAKVPEGDNNDNHNIDSSDEIYAQKVSTIIIIIKSVRTMVKLLIEIVYDENDSLKIIVQCVMTYFGILSTRILSYW